MRLTCPACGAAYEVGPEIVPADGRMVRCSACRAEWRARPAAPEARGGSDPAAGATPPSGSAVAEPQGDREATVGEKTPSLADRPRDAKRSARPGLSAGGRESGGAAPDLASAPQARPDAAPRARGSKPVEREEPPAPMLASLEGDDDGGASGRGGFVAGFAVAALICLGALALYLRADAVAAAAPRLAEPLADYVALVDEARRALADAARDARRAIEELVSAGAAAFR